MTVALTGLAFVLANEQAVGYLLLALAGLLALRWMLEDPPRTRLSRGLRLLENKPIQGAPSLFTEASLFVEPDEPTPQARRAYRYRRLTIRTTRPVHRLRFTCTGPIYTHKHELKVHRWQERLPPTDAFFDLPDENVLVATFLPAPFSAYHELVLTLGSTADFRVARIQVARLNLRARAKRIERALRPPAH